MTLRDAANPTGHAAVARLYHNWITGLVLSLTHRAGVPVAADFVFRLFRQQHLKRFLPGLEKLGLTDKPDAVACAMYHYLSNQIGGVKVEYLAESDKKAWVRYPPPRWIWDGTAICGIPTEVNLQMMRGWHAHNGVSLNNPRLGFVCTGMTTDGAPGLEGYYFEYDYELTEDQRLRFAPDETCPPIDRASMPQLDVKQWPEQRQAKAYLYYAMEYISNALPLLESTGDTQLVATGELCARQTGMHGADLLARAFDCRALSDTLTSPAAMASDLVQLLASVLAADGSTVSCDNNTVRLSDWRLFEQASVSDATLNQVSACLAGIVATHNRFLSLSVHRGSDQIAWTLQST
ncbi:MAG: hypothetical protein WBD34_18815 [Burkholderiaceae bacterium]